MIRTFLFDMGNVLVHFSHKRMCAQMGALCGQSGEQITELLLKSGFQLDFERGKFTDEEFHNRFSALVGVELDFHELKQAGADIFELNEPIVSIVDALKTRGFRLVLLSNTSKPHFEFVRKTFDILDRFDDFVLSYEVGAVKPEPAIFEAALQKIDCDPGQCFYTDDIPEYIETARNFGLQAEVFTDADSLRRQLAERNIAMGE